MRLSLHFELANNKVVLNYRASILSFIKHLIEKTNKDYYNLLYAKNVIKGFTFSVYLPNSKISGKNYELSENRFTINFSFLDPAIFIVFYNAFNYFRNQEYKIENNSMILRDIRMINEKMITSDNIKIKFLSPLVLRLHDKASNKDRYITFEDDNFNIELNKSVALLCDRLKFENIDSTLIELIPCKAKKTVAPFKETSMSCCFGEFLLKGDRLLLNNLYKSGIGSRRSEGFGMFDILQDGVDNNGK